MRLKIDVKGIEETKNNLKRIAKGIDKAKSDTLQQIGNEGMDFARALSPKDEGYLMQGIINFPEGDETWIIMSSPPADTPDFPLNQLIDAGAIDSLNWGERTEPKTGEFGFMQSTYKFLENEFKNRLQIKIDGVLK